MAKNPGYMAKNPGGSDFLSRPDLMWFLAMKEPAFMVE